MKQKKFNKKLSLNKKTIANLNNSEKGNVFGGVETGETCLIESVCICPPPTEKPTCPNTCALTCPNTCHTACSAGGVCC